MTLFNLGDKVTYYTGTRYDTDVYDVPITKIGRKYVTVEIGDGHLKQFHKDTGAERDSAFIARGRIETAEMTAKRLDGEPVEDSIDRTGEETHDEA